MRVLTVDVEASGANHANSFGVSNKLACVGLFDGKHYSFVDIEHGALPYAVGLEQITQAFARAELVIGFGIKYDLNWLHRYIPNLPRKPVFDCQLAQFILDAQTSSYPSLNDVLLRYALRLKDERIKNEYWDQGRSTLEVPVELLREYNEYDCTGTYQVYLRQRELLKGNQVVLFRLHCDDLLVLQEMEYNGLLYNTEESLRLAKEIEGELNATYDLLKPYALGRDINWNSPKQCSAVLYGGEIVFKVRESTERTLKSGERKFGERWGEQVVLYPRLVSPLEKTELQDGSYSVNEDALRSLKATGAAGTLVRLILKVSELDKLRGTYYLGIPNIIRKYDWEPQVIHGNISQCVAKTGRTASSKPNIQNFDPRLKPLFYSRYTNEN
jgi:DNA polymerase I-like protein with 3'-5' exonuclease and polymerase domains